MLRSAPPPAIAGLLPADPIFAQTWTRISPSTQGRLNEAPALSIGFRPTGLPSQMFDRKNDDDESPRTTQHNSGVEIDMKPTENPQGNLAIGRRSFLSGATALGVGAGLAAHANAADTTVAEKSTIALRDHDLPFIATEETYTTDELIALNAINDDHV